MHSVMIKVMAAGGHGAQWVRVDQVCHSVVPSSRKGAVSRLVENRWLILIGDMVQITTEGLIALEGAQ